MFYVEEKQKNLYCYYSNVFSWCPYASYTAVKVFAVNY